MPFAADRRLGDASAVSTRDTILRDSVSTQRRLVLKTGIVGLAVAAAAALLATGPFITPKALPEAMDPAAPQRCIGVFLVCVALWVTNLIPPAATGLLAIVLLPVFNILSEREAFGLFGNSAVFFMLGVFLLAGGTISTGLSKRVTLIVLQRFDRSPERLFTGVTVSAVFLSLWMPEHAVAAMIYPIVVEIVDTLRLQRGNSYAKKLFLGMGWGAVIGGTGTFLGGARTPLALSMLRDVDPSARISFLGWAAAAIPVVVVMTFVAIMVLRTRVPNDIDNIKAATHMLDERVRRLGPMSGPEQRLAGLGILTIIAWITVGHTVGLAVIAILSSILLFALRIVEWRSVEGYVNWGVLVMYGGAVALGHALDETRALAWMAGRLITPETPKVLIIVLMVGAAILLTEVISNSAAVAILLPVGYSLGSMTGSDSVTMTLAVAIPSGLAFLLPVSSPPNAISFASGHYSVREAVKLGWPMPLVGFTVVVAVMLIWWQFVLGFNVW
ncbi:MAG: SLC13 family permease [Phycisphaerae bacterium]